MRINCGSVLGASDSLRCGIYGVPILGFGKFSQVSLTFLLLAGTISGQSSGGGHNIFGPQQPVFDDFTIREVEAAEGQTLLLPCTVRYLGDKVVSWIRSRDLNILSSGGLAFSGDSRFEPVVAAPEFWGLRIRGAHISDSGQYECQINTEPKQSLAVNLTVSGARMGQNAASKWVGSALIKGPREVYVRNGSLVALVCEISYLSTGLSTATVRWLHDGQEIINLTDNKHRISNEVAVNGTKRTVIGSLHISQAARTDSGQYTCLQMSVMPDRINLFVVEEEIVSEAMQRDFPISSNGTNKSKLFMLLLFLMTLPTL